MPQQEKEQLSTSNDLSKDMEFEGSELKNQEGFSQSTATEGELKTPEENTADQPHPAKEDTQTTESDPTYRPTLAEDESMDKEQG